MKSQQFVKRLIVSILLVYYYQQTTAARMIKGSKANYITMVNNQTKQTLEINSVTESVLNKTSTIDTTNMPELETTTLPADFEVDGRHAFIHNQFVAEDEESLAHDTLASQKLPPRPISDYDPNPSEDYEDEETNDYLSENDSGPENCDDNQASCDKEIQTQFAQETEIQPDYQNKLYDSTNYKNPTNTNLIGAYYNNTFVPNIHRNPGLLYPSKPNNKPLAQHLYTLTDSNRKHLQNTAQYSAGPSTQYIQNSATIQQTNKNLLTPQYNLNDKLNNTTEPQNLPHNLNTMNTFFKPNFSYDNSNIQATSPSASSFGQNKKFKTVSSSVQYVATPLADLVFKFSIGMSKHTNSKAVNNSSDHQGNSIIEFRNHINGKTK